MYTTLKSDEFKEIKNLKVKNLRVKNACIANLSAKSAQLEKLKVIGLTDLTNLKATNGTFNTLNVNETIYINGSEIQCYIAKMSNKNFNTPYDCLDCNGIPIKPDNINSDIWDFLTCNRDAYQNVLQQQFLDGRNQIRCIKQSYGCPADCPPDCPAPATCSPIFNASISDNILTVLFLQPDTGLLLIGDSIFSYNPTDPQVINGTTILEQISGDTGGIGTYIINISQNISSAIDMKATHACPNYTPGQTGPCSLLPPSCIPDGQNCNLEVTNNLFATQTLPFYNFSNECGGTVSTNGFPYRQSSFLNFMGYNLNINNITCNLGQRVASILVHYAYKNNGITGNTGSTGSNCPICPGRNLPDPLTCICPNPSNDIVCGIISLECKQFGPTINIDLGENWSGQVNIPFSIIQEMINNTILPVNLNDITGAFQLAIFLEDGLTVSNNRSVSGVQIRGGSCSGNNCTNNGQAGCFIGDSKILLPNGKTELAKNIKVGDKVATPNGSPLEIIAITYQKPGPRNVVKINNLLISAEHRIIWENKWIRPDEIPNVEIVHSEESLYNFITDRREPIIVEGIVASTIGMLCGDGTHDLEKYPTQRLWCTEKIIGLLKKEKSWPFIIYENNDELLKNMKDAEWVIKYLREN